MNQVAIKGEEVRASPSRTGGRGRARLQNGMNAKRPSDDRPPFADRAASRSALTRLTMCAGSSKTVRPQCHPAHPAGHDQRDLGDREFARGASPHDRQKIQNGNDTVQLDFMKSFSPLQRQVTTRRRHEFHWRATQRGFDPLVTSAYSV